MRLSFFRTLLVLGLLGAAAPVSAQSQGFQLNRYEPTAAGEWGFAVDHPWYSSLRRLAAGVTLNYGHNPLLLESLQRDGSYTQTALIGHQLIGHIDLAASFANRVLISFSLPFTLLERGDDTTANRFGVKLVSVAAVGDPRFGAMFRVFGDPYRSAISLSLGGYVWVPINSGAFPAQTGETNFRYLPRFVLAGLGRHILWSVTGSFYFRPDGVLGNLEASRGNSIGREMQLGGAIAYADLARRFSIGPEAIMSTPLSDNAFDPLYTNVELLLGANYNIARLIQLGVAAGGGLLRGPGTPDARVLLRLAYAPMADDKPKDKDNDGIADKDDACPEEAGIRTANPATHGCPLPPPADGDQDGVIDAQDQCPAELAGARPDPDKSGCPLRDRDGDGIYDNQDQCPDAPAGQRPDSAKPGCPLGDRDGDGVYDSEDQCIAVPAGPHPSLSSKGCPDKDSDGDGVYDSQDPCPTVPSGFNPDPQKPGCPLPDRDQDQIADAVDACPDKPGSPSADPKKNGCPGLVEVKGGQIIIKEQLFFAPFKDAVLKRSFALLDIVALSLQTLPQIKRVMIEGHTDNQGKLDVNTRLSEGRARSVMSYLIGKGVAAGRLEAKGFGPTQPIADNKTPKGRALNRRVDFKIIDPPQASAAPQAALPAVAPLPAPSRKVPAQPRKATAAPAGKTGTKAGAAKPGRGEPAVWQSK